MKNIEFAVVSEINRERFNIALNKAVQNGWSPWGTNVETAYSPQGVRYSILISRPIEESEKEE